MELGKYQKPEGMERYVKQIPGLLTPPFEFKIKENEQVFEAICIIPFGLNPKKTIPVIAWVSIEKEIFSPEYFFKLYLGEIWKDNQQNSRFFTLYNTQQNLKVKLYRNLDSSYFCKTPLACFEKEGQETLPETYIDIKANYGIYIHEISKGNLENSINLYIENAEEIDYAYPLLKRLNNNILNVYNNQISLEWFDDHKTNLVDDILSQQREIKNFKDLDIFFKDLYKKKSIEEKYEKGILSLIAKAFCYVPDL